MKVANIKTGLTDIMENKDDIKVSVICITYNHEKFLRECLDSMVCQKTNFPFEIIVHDDKSSDKTVEIIKEVNFLTFDPIQPNVFPTIFALEDIIDPNTPPATPNIPANLDAIPNGLINILENKLIFPVFLLLISHILALSFLSLTLMGF